MVRHRRLSNVNRVDDLPDRQRTLLGSEEMQDQDA